MKRFLIAIIAISSFLSSYAQMDTEFWFAAPFFNCPHGETSPYKLVVFSFDQAATVTISMPANPSFTPITKNIPANGYTSIVLANNKQDGDNKITSPYNSISQRGLLIQSTSKVECYYQVDGDNSEAYTLKGKNALGRDFLVIGQKSYSNGTSGSTAGSRCSVHIVATEDHTEVQINPSAAILLSNGNSSSAPITITLNKGETYAIASYNVQATMNLIGTTITSSKPIAVTINDDSVMPNSNADCIGEQILPTDFAGTKFIVVSGGNRYDACIIFALQNNTQITTSQGGIYNINRGSYQTISMNGVNAMSIQTSQPVMVFQILSTLSGSGEMGGSIVPHVECTGSSIAGYKSYSSSYNLYINLITKKSNISHFAINGVGLSASSFLPVDVSDEYYYARVQKQASSTPYVVTCSSGLFQMGVTEGNSYTSSTYGFFSDYAEQVPILIDVNSMPVDSVYYTNRTESLSLFAHPESGFDLSNIEWTLPDGSKRYGNTINLGVFRNELLGEYSVTGTTTQCGVIDHPFVIKLNTVEVNEYASFCEGDSFTWTNHFMPDGITPMTFSFEGTYRDTITSTLGSDSICILHLTSMPLPNMTIRPDTTIMPGESVFLWAKGVDYCRWTPENTLTKTDELKIYARPTATTTYIVTGYSILSSSQNVVYNGGFEDGNTGFNSNLNYITPYTITGGCGDYTITDNVKGFWMRYSHSSTAYSGTNMMIIDGATSPNSIIWQQNVQVEPHTYYAFSAQVMSCLTSNSYGQYALLQFSVNGTQLGPIFHSPSKLYNWTQYYQIWYSGDNTTATLTILNQNNSGNGNDFAIDEIRFDALSYSCETIKQVTIHVAGQTIESNENASFCEGDSFTWPNHFMPDGVTPMTFSSEGTYRDTITSASGSDSICILHLTSTPLPNMTIRPDTTIMPGDSAILWARGVDFCRWTPENSLSKTSDNLIYAHPTQTTTYTTYGYNLSATGNYNLVYNGDFEQGNVGFNTSLNYFAPNTYHQGYGSYSISNDIIGFWKNQQVSIKAYGGSGNMMIVDGSTTPNATVWSQQVAVEPNTYYAFSAQVMSCFASHMHGQYALLQFSVNGTQLGPILHSPNVIHSWTQYYEIWFSGNNTSATLTILNQNNDGLGNDFAIDEIRFDALDYSCEAIKQVTINVKGQDTDSTEIASICAGDTYTWHGRQFNTTTTITETIPNSAGGDSVCTLLLTVLEPSDSIEIATICAGETYTWHGQTFSTSTTQTETLINAVGCDSVCTLQLTVLDHTDSIEVATICAGETYTWHGQTFSTSTTRTETLINAAGCDSVCTLQLTVLDHTDSIEVATICAGETYTWHGQTFSSSTTQTETLINAVGCDSVCTLRLTVFPSPTTDISASITEGAAFTWNGQAYTVAGDYTLSFTTLAGCDSVVTLHLIVNPLTYEIQTHTQCADDPYVEFEVVATDALFHHLQFTFAPNALNQHYRDTIVDFTNSLIQIPNSARAGIYEVSISPMFDEQVLDTRSYQFTLLYPSTVLDQHWDDFIGVLTHDYNGGYDFSGFQWYKDGTPISGENHSYLYQPLEMGASYSAMLEEKDGTKLMTCEITAIPQTEIALYPTLLQPHQLVRLHSSDEVMIQLYNNLGTLVSSHIFSSGDHQFAAPSERGVYIVKLQQTSTNGKSATKKLLVR